MAPPPLRLDWNDFLSPRLAPRKRSSSDPPLDLAPRGAHLPSLGHLLASVADADARAGFVAASLGAPSGVAETAAPAPAADDEHLPENKRQCFPFDAHVNTNASGTNAHAAVNSEARSGSDHDSGTEHEQAQATCPAEHVTNPQAATAAGMAEIDAAHAEMHEPGGSKCTSEQNAAEPLREQTSNEHNKHCAGMSLTTACGKDVQPATSAALDSAKQLFCDREEQTKDKADSAGGSLQIMTAGGANVQFSANALACAQRLLGVESTPGANAELSRSSEKPASRAAFERVAPEPHSACKPEISNAGERGDTTSREEICDSAPRRKLKRPRGAGARIQECTQKKFNPPKLIHETNHSSANGVKKKKQQQQRQHPTSANEGEEESEELHHLYEGVQRIPLAAFFKRRPFECRKGTEKASSSTLSITADKAAAWKEPLSGKGLKVARQRLLRAGAKASALKSGWLTHHFRLVVWKNASYERAFPLECAGHALCIDRVVDELLYRYEREIHRGHFPALKRVLEGSTPSQAPMNLCIAAIRKGNTLLELTDGWYCIHAQLDSILSEAAAKGRLFAGLKLRVQGMIIDSGESMPALEAMQSVKASLSANCVRRERWDARLGPARRLVIALPGIHVQGGIVPAVQVRCVRVYDPVFVEDVNGGERRVWRSSSVERDVQEELEHMHLDELEEGTSEESLRRLGVAPRERVVRKLQKLRVRGCDEDGTRTTDAELSFFTSAAEEEFEIKEGSYYLFSQLYPGLPRSIRTPSMHLSIRGTKRTRMQKIMCEEPSRILAPQRQQLRSSDLCTINAAQDVDIIGLLLWCSGVETTDRPSKERQRLFLADGEGDELIFLQREFQAGCYPSLGPKKAGATLRVRDAFFDKHDRSARVFQLCGDESTRVEYTRESTYVHEWATNNPEHVEALRERVRLLTSGEWNTREESSELDCAALDEIDELMQKRV